MPTSTTSTTHLQPPATRRLTAVAVAMGVVGGMGCLPSGSYPLAPILAETPHAVSAAQVSYTPSQGWDLTVVLTLRNPDTDQNRRFDLSSVWVRADGGPWEACQHPAGVDQDLLLFTLSPGEARQRVVQCLGVARPSRELEVRFAVSHAGESRGVEILRYGGVVQ